MSRAKIPTSKKIDDFSAELAFAGDRADLVRRIDRLWATLEALGLDDKDVKLIELGRGEKKNFAQRLSTALAQKTANALRAKFPGIQPDEDGRGHESLSKSASGMKKLDVNYSPPRSGLELAVSLKTINFKDEGTGRYTKNTKRIDGELRAEAEDCHQRQPYAVLVAYLLLPADAASDGKAGPSSLKHNADMLARRAGRSDTKNHHSSFELTFVGVYSDAGPTKFYVPSEVPDNGVPRSSLTFSETLEQVRALHARRNAKR